VVRGTKGERAYPEWETVEEVEVAFGGGEVGVV
jgi:hypothetical protein